MVRRYHLHRYAGTCGNKRHSALRCSAGGSSMVRRHHLHRYAGTCGTKRRAAMQSGAYKCAALLCIVLQTVAADSGQ
jgi:hypothetical protein